MIIEDGDQDRFVAKASEMEYTPPANEAQEPTEWEVDTEEWEVDTEE